MTLLCYFQVDLLLGKAYSDWGHISDAVSVYDQLISSYPNDFRGYLAKVHHIICLMLTKVASFYLAILRIVTSYQVILSTEAFDYGKAYPYEEFNLEYA